MAIIKAENLTHIYQPGMPFEKVALNDVSFEIEQGDFVALIGHTGSGKSTLIQHFNALENNKVRHSILRINLYLFRNELNLKF